MGSNYLVDLIGGTEVESIGSLTGLLAPIAFTFAISAYSQIRGLKKEIDQLREEIEILKRRQM
jgi:hypothetical protein